MKRKNLSKQRGITLIALVVTIVVLLILAGVSIAMLAGEDGIIANAQAAKIDSIHGEVKEAVILKYGEYEIAKKTTQNTQTFIEYLKDKECIDEDGVVDTQKLTGKKLGLGNGEVNESGKFDVYTIEEIDDMYELNYSDKDTSVDEISLWHVAISQEINGICRFCGRKTIDGVCTGCGIEEQWCDCQEGDGEECPDCGNPIDDCECGEEELCPDCGNPIEGCECGEEEYETCVVCGGEASDGECIGCEEPEESCNCNECPDCGYPVEECVCGE